LSRVGRSLAQSAEFGAVSSGQPPFRRTAAPRCHAAAKGRRSHRYFPGDSGSLAVLDAERERLWTTSEATSRRLDAHRHEVKRPSLLGPSSCRTRRARSFPEVCRTEACCRAAQMPEWLDFAQPSDEQKSPADRSRVSTRVGATIPVWATALEGIAKTNRAHVWVINKRATYKRLAHRIRTTIGSWATIRDRGGRCICCSINGDHGRRRGGLCERPKPKRDSSGSIRIANAIRRESACRDNPADFSTADEGAVWGGR
jgi:hypothetical protein